MVKRITLLCLFGFSTAAAAELFDETKATTLFAFDTVSIPHTQGAKNTDIRLSALYIRQ